MGDTTLTKDTIRELRELAQNADSTGHGLHVTPRQMMDLCDAAERAETLEAEVAKWNKCDSLVCPYEQRALQAEAQLTEVTRERGRLQHQVNRQDDHAYEICGCSHAHDGHCMYCCLPLSNHRRCAAGTLDPPE